MGDPENMSVEGLSISAGGSGSGTNTSALRVRQKYILTDKATEADKQEADRTSFHENVKEKFIILVYLNGVNHNDFATYVTDKLGRAK